MNAAIMNYQFEDSALDQAVTALVMAPVQIAMGTLWLLWNIVRYIESVVRENAQLMLSLVTIVGVVLILVTQPQIAFATVVVCAFAWITRPTGRRR